MKAPKKYVFTKVLSHRAFGKIRQMNVEYVSLYSFGEKRSASSSNILISEKDYEKIKNIKGVSSAKDTINGNDWLARNESEKLKKIFRNMNSKYKQGGKIDRAALIDTNTAIATKNKLKKNFDLPFEVAVYVPSTSDANKNISKQDFEKRINEVSEYLANVFGGFSSNEVSGGYVSSEKGLIKEGVYKVTSFASKENLDSNMKKLISQIKKWCKEWSQESIGLEFEGDLYYLSETAEYKNGGIMYAKGGKVKKGDVGKSGTQYGYTLKEWEQNAKKRGLLVSPTQWWKSQEGKSYTDSFGRKKKVGQHSGDERQSMNMYGYLIANGLDLGSKIIPASAIKYVKENDYMKYAQGGDIAKIKTMAEVDVIDFNDLSNIKLGDILVQMIDGKYPYLVQVLYKGRKDISVQNLNKMTVLPHNWDSGFIDYFRQLTNKEKSAVFGEPIVLNKKYMIEDLYKTYSKSSKFEEGEVVRVLQTYLEKNNLTPIQRYQVFDEENLVYDTLDDNFVKTSYYKKNYGKGFYQKYAKGGDIESTFTYQIGGL